MQTSLLGYVFLGLHSLLFHRFSSQEINRPDLGPHLNTGILTLPTLALPNGASYNGNYSLTALDSRYKNCLKSEIDENSPHKSVLKIDSRPCDIRMATDLSQGWQIIPEKIYGAGYFKLRNVLSDKCMQVGTVSDIVDNNTPIVLAKCADRGEFAQNQAFASVKMRPFELGVKISGLSPVQFRHVQSNLCVSSPVESGSSLYISDCVDLSDNQWFRFMDENEDVTREEPLNIPHGWDWFPNILKH